jgi:antitoxin (DNA-binding transcriptional repressor) of toxin-antitoxin stability system
MTAAEVSATFFAVLDMVAAGEDVEITKQDRRVVARLVPATGAQSLRSRFAGVAFSVVDDEELFTTDASWNRP